MRALLATALALVVSGCQRQNPAALVWKEQHAALKERLSNVAAEVAAFQAAVDGVEKTDAAVEGLSDAKRRLDALVAARNAAATALDEKDRALLAALDTADGKALEALLAETKKDVGGALQALEAQAGELGETVDELERAVGARVAPATVDVAPSLDATKPGETALHELDFDGEALDSGATTKQLVAMLVKVLGSCKGVVAELEVHSAKADDASAAKRLTEAQAATLKKALLAAKVPPAHLASARGLGDEKPAVETTPKATPMQQAKAKSLNDRVVVRITKPCPVK